jgi:hypothetical protein
MPFVAEKAGRLWESACRDGLRGVREQRADLANKPREFFSTLWEGLRAGHIKPFVVNGLRIERGPDYDQFRSNRLFESFVTDSMGENCGLHVATTLREGRHSQIPGYAGNRFFENAVNTAAFSSILGQISYSATLDLYNSPEFIAQQLYSVEQAGTLYEEMVPGVAVLGNMSEPVGEGEEYPEVGLTPEYITIPRKIKKGFQISLTEEIAWEDKTGLVMQRANTGVESMAYEHDEETIDLAAGITTLYSRNGGPKQATYADTHTQGNFDNLAGSNALVDWKSVEAAENLFANMTDPNTGRRIMIGGKQMLIPWQLRYTAATILNATEVQNVDNQAVAGTLRAKYNNPISGYNVVTNTIVADRTSSTTTWFIGDFKKAFGYSEVWPVQTFTQDRSSEAGFARDIIAKIKWRRMGAHFVRDPRYVIKNTN